jgi:GH15 family glucan-1,4-alpha-glucosidase
MLPGHFNYKSWVTITILMICSLVFGNGPFDYFQNSWSLVGLKDYENGTRITPANELMLSQERLVKIRFGRNLESLNRKQIKTCLDGWLPVILLNAQDDSVRYDFKIWAGPLPSVTNWRKAYNWPTEGENYLNWVWIKVTNLGNTTTTAKLKAEVGDKSNQKLPLHEWSLKPNQIVEAVYRIPFGPIEQATNFEEEAPQLWLDRTVAYWRNLISTGATFKLPCQKVNDARLAALVLQLITTDHGEIQGGEGFYDGFYIRDGAYQIMQLEEAGLWDAADNAIEFFLKAQKLYGRFETQETQYDANGQALWALWQYYKITGYKYWLEEVFPKMYEGALWPRKSRVQEQPGSPFAGLLINAPADGEYLWESKHHIVGYDLWNLRGMLCTIDAAKALGKKKEVEILQREANEYRAAIDAALKKTGVDYFPPSWELDGTHWGNTETLWPTELFELDDTRVTASLKEVRENHGGGFIENTIQWLGKWPAIHPYMSSYSSMASLVRGEHEKVVEEFYWYLLHSTATHAFPEGVFQNRRMAWFHTIPHGTGASNYATWLRHMLVHERGDELDLLSAVPDWWLENGKEIRIERAPTHFGEMGLVLRGKAEGVEIEFDPPDRIKPKRIILYLPQSRPLINAVDGIDIIVRPDQKQRWSFDKVVDLYEKQAVPIDYSIYWKDQE